MAQRDTPDDHRPTATAGYGREVQQGSPATGGSHQQARDYNSAQMGGFGNPADYGNGPAYTPQNAFGGTNVSLGAQQAHFGPQQASGWPGATPLHPRDPRHFDPPHYDHGNRYPGAIEGPWDERNYAAGQPAFSPSHERPPVQHQAYQPGQIHGGPGGQQDYPQSRGIGSGVHNRFVDYPYAQQAGPQGGFESSHYYGNQQPQNRHAGDPQHSPGEAAGSKQPSLPSTAGGTSQ